MPRQADDRVRLLHGPYQPPPLRFGDRATCLFRDCDVVVTGGTDAPSSPAYTTSPPPPPWRPAPSTAPPWTGCRPSWTASPRSWTPWPPG
jgi:hypothetical protein